MLRHFMIALLALSLMAPQAFAVQSLSVAFSGAELRSAPSATASKVVLKAVKYYPLTVLQTGKEYYQVSDYRGRTGYIHKTLLRAQPAIVVTSENANVRSGPGTGWEVVTQLSQGDSARLIGRDKGWLQVATDDGRTGWIADFLVWGE